MAIKKSKILVLLTVSILFLVMGVALTSNLVNGETETETILPPKEPLPEDKAKNVGNDRVNVNLSVLVEHEAENKMDVEFYDASDDSLVGIDEDVESGERANTTWEELANVAKYEWYAVADAGEENARSAIWRFLTWGELEESTVSTGGADNITDNSATLHGTLERIGTTFEVDVHFEWRKTGDETWNETPEQTLNSTGGFNHELTDLEPETEYEFRCVSNHRQTCSILTFTTESEVEEDESIPGFTSLPLVVASIIAVAVYYKKGKKQ